MHQSQPARSRNGAASPWKLELQGGNEQAINGRKFAQAIALVAAGRYEDVVKKKKEFPAFKKIFWDEPLHNPPIANAPESYAYDAHDIEQTKFWERAGKKFRTGDRMEAPRDYRGPMNPKDFPHLFEKPILCFPRNRVLQPFSRARKYNKPLERCEVNPEKAYLDMRTSLIGPLTYQLPDLWEMPGKSLLGANPEQSAFKSHTERFSPKKGAHSDFPSEKAGTSIPHSRGRSRGGGFRQETRQDTEKKTADLENSASASSWSEFKEEGEEKGGLAVGEVDLDRLYLLGDPRTMAGTDRRAKSVSSLHASAGRNAGAGGGGVVGRGAYTNHQHVFTGRAIPEMGHSHRSSSQSSPVFQSHIVKSRTPGFTFVNKSEPPAFKAVDHNKSFRRVVLPDGTSVILPTNASHEISSPQSRPRSHSPSNPQSMPPPEIEASRHSLANTGPFLRGITPPRRVPPSLAPTMSADMDMGGGGMGSTGVMGGFGMVQGSPPPSRQTRSQHQQEYVQYRSEPMDDESTEPVTGFGRTYSRNLMEKWTPPVYYSRKNKSPAVNTGTIPSRHKSYTVRKTPTRHGPSITIFTDSGGSRPFTGMEPGTPLSGMPASPHVPLAGFGDSAYSEKI